jgi:uncharacterized protein (DUF1330 family)
MNTRYKIAFAMLASAGLGAAVIEGLHAQATPPAYAVIVIRKINDADALKPVILAKGPAAAESAGGKFVIRTDKITSLDGMTPARYIVIQFDNMEKAMAWHNAEAQKEVDAIRMKTTDSLAFIVEGVAK